MAVFHLTSHCKLAAVILNGIRPARRCGERARIFAMPVTRNFQISHQWQFELGWTGGGTTMGDYFRMPDKLAVDIGHSGSFVFSVTAAGVVGRAEASSRRVEWLRRARRAARGD